MRCSRIGRGNAKSALSAGIALGALLGTWDRQPRREILIAARTRDQARVAWDFVAGFAASLPEDVQAQLIYRRSPRLEIEYEGDGGGHVIRHCGGRQVGTRHGACAGADGRARVWPADRGDALEDSLMSGLGKRGGRALIISTSAPDDAHPFSSLPGSCSMEFYILQL